MSKRNIGRARLRRVQRRIRLGSVSVDLGVSPIVTALSVEINSPPLLPFLEGLSMGINKPNQFAPFVKAISIEVDIYSTP